MDCKTKISRLLSPWKYCSLTISHRNDILKHSFLTLRSGSPNDRTTCTKSEQAAEPCWRTATNRWDFASERGSSAETHAGLGGPESETDHCAHWRAAGDLWVSAGLSATGKGAWFYDCFNSLGPGDAILWYRTVSTLAQVMACCLMAPNHYLNQCWLFVWEVAWHLSEGIHFSLLWWTLNHHWY